MRYEGAVVGAVIIVIGIIVYNGVTEQDVVNSPAEDLVTKQTESPSEELVPLSTSRQQEHGEQRAREARAGDSHRNVGDVNRIKREGKEYIDADTGHHVCVRGNDVYIEAEDGTPISRFHNPRRNTQNRTRRGERIPVEESSIGSSSSSGS